MAELSGLVHPCWSIELESQWHGFLHIATKQGCWARSYTGWYSWWLNRIARLNGEIDWPRFNVGHSLKTNRLVQIFNILVRGFWLSLIHVWLDSAPFIIIEILLSWSFEPPMTSLTFPSIWAIWAFRGRWLETSRWLWRVRHRGTPWKWAATLSSTHLCRLATWRDGWRFRSRIVSLASDLLLRCWASRSAPCIALPLWRSFLHSTVGATRRRSITASPLY